MEPLSDDPTLPREPAVDLEFGGTGRFLVRRRIGAGSFGVVYQVYDREWDAVVALKALKRVVPEALYRFKLEFRSLAELSHPNLVRLHELFFEGGTWFFTMEYIEGTDFIGHVRGRDDSGTGPDGATPPTPKELLRLRRSLAQLGRGLSFLHRSRLLHRDLKPSNVVVSTEERVILVDFGLLKDLTSKDATTSGLVVGTPAYMAPEQACGLPVSEASDWYSVGVMLYEALVGRHPFHGYAREDLVRRERPLPPPGELAPGIPEDLSGLCLDLLDRDPGRRPVGQQVLERLGSATDGDTASPSGPPPGPAWIAAPLAPASELFVGREECLLELAEAFRAVQRGQSVAQLVHGSSGVGKTTLVQHFIEKLQERERAVVLAGRCFERESVPFKALDSLLDALSRYLEGMSDHDVEVLMPRHVGALSRIFPVLKSVPAVAAAGLDGGDAPDDQEMRRRAFLAFRELLARIAMRVPVVLFIDDLHWGDVDSAELLLELFRPPDPPPLLLIGCYRTGDVARSPCLSTLFTWKQSPSNRHLLRWLAVEELSREESRALAFALLSRHDPGAMAETQAIAEESGGNPLFVRELTRYLSEGIHLQPPFPLETLSLDEVLWQRILQLPAPSRRLLEVLAVHGQPLPQPVALRSAGVGGDAWALHALRTGHFARATAGGDGLETTHDRIRETVVAHLPASDLAKHHRQLALGLERAGHGDPETLATHFLGAGEPARAGTYYSRAADEAAAALAFDRAAKLYRRALDLSGEDPFVPADLRRRLADALANAGRGTEAAREYEAAARQLPAQASLELERRAAYQYCISGHLDEGRAAFHRVLERVGMKLPASPRRAFLSLLVNKARLAIRGVAFEAVESSRIDPAVLTRIDVAWAASAGLSMFDVIVGADFQTRSCLLALRAGEPSRVARALAWEAAHTSNFGGRAWRRTSRLLEVAERVASGVEGPYARGLTRLARGIAEFTGGRWLGARRFLEEAEAILRGQCTGVAWELGTSHAFGLWSLFYLGDLAQLSQRASELRAEAYGRGDMYAFTTHGAFAEPVARLTDDAPDEARHAVQSSLALWSSDGFHVQHFLALLSLTYADLYGGRGGAAWERMEERWPALSKSHLLNVQVIRVIVLNARARSALAAAREARRPGPLLRAARASTRRLEGERMPYARSFAGLLRAGLAAAEGRPERAVELFHDAARSLDAGHMTLFAAAARRRGGELMGGDAGRRMIEDCDHLMRARNVRRPSAMSDALAPGG